MLEPATGVKEGLLDDLRQSLGPSAVSDNSDVLTKMGTDLFTWDGLEQPSAMVSPTNTDDVVSILDIAKSHGRPIYVRGGGMSYTNAYGPTEPDSILLDMGGLNRIREVDVTNRYIIAEAGCTWKDVADALKPFNMVVDFPAPLSGSHSTVGGAMSQNIPGGMHGVLGLEVVLPNGSVVRTGSWSSKSHPTPFLRNYGPDVTGLFTGDSGVFGIKTAASIHIKLCLEGAAYGSFAFESYQDMAEAMIELSPMDFITRRTGLDPYETANISKVGLGDAIKTVAATVGGGMTLSSGIRSAAKLASGGLNFLKGVKWSLHLKIDGVTDRAAEDGMECARKVCLKLGRELPPILPRARDAVGFSIRKFLGKDGERWVATSSLWSIGRAVEVAREIEGFFEKRRDKMEKLGIHNSYITNFSPHYFLCEPCLYWNDSLEPLHLENISASESEKFSKFKPNMEVREYVRELRYELRDFLQDLGSIHVQIGDFYHFRNVISPEAADLLSVLKGALDPEGRINPGKLDGLVPSQK